MVLANCRSGSPLGIAIDVLAPDHSVALEPFLAELIGGSFRDVAPPEGDAVAVGLHRVVADILAGDVEPLQLLGFPTQGGPSGFRCSSNAASPAFLSWFV